MKSIIKVDEMSCSHCKMVVEEAVSQVQGVDACEVNLEEGMVEIEGTADLNEVVSVIHKVGYRAHKV